MTSSTIASLKILIRDTKISIVFPSHRVSSLSRSRGLSLTKLALYSLRTVTGSLQVDLICKIIYSTARNYGTICRDFASVESRFSSAVSPRQNPVYPH